jgi:hypothetical protein
MVKRNSYCSSKKRKNYCLSKKQKDYWLRSLTMIVRWKMKSCYSSKERKS